MFDFRFWNYGHSIRMQFSFFFWTSSRWVGALCRCIALVGASALLVRLSRWMQVRSLMYLFSLIYLCTCCSSLSSSSRRSAVQWSNVYSYECNWSVLHIWMHLSMLRFEYFSKWMKLLLLFSLISFRWLKCCNIVALLQIFMLIVRFCFGILKSFVCWCHVTNRFLCVVSPFLELL